MELKKFEDELTGSEYADVQAFEDLKVQIVFNGRLGLPQIDDDG